MSIDTDPFAAVFPGPRGTEGPKPPAPLSGAEALRLARTYLPELAERADRERRVGGESLSKRDASWALAALMWQAVAPDRSLDATDWWEQTDQAFWLGLGFPRRPGLAEARRYLVRALHGRELKQPAAKAMVSVLPHLARSVTVPGSYVDGNGSRRVLRRRDLKAGS